MAKNQPDYILDLQSRRMGDAPPVGNVSSSVSTGKANDAGVAAGGSGASSGGTVSQARPWIAVHWKCCQTYSRIYRNKTGIAYEGRCPKCAAPVRATVGQGGTANRFFEAG